MYNNHYYGSESKKYARADTSYLSWSVEHENKLLTNASLITLYVTMIYIDALSMIKEVNSIYYQMGCWPSSPVKGFFRWLLTRG
jgi:hypothetical protein